MLWEATWRRTSAQELTNTGEAGFLGVSWEMHIVFHMDRELNYFGSLHFEHLWFYSRLQSFNQIFSALALNFFFNGTSQTQKWRKI